jgi:putative ABC transport system permease protein
MPLPLLLAWRRLAQHPLQSLATLLGVALGLTVAAAILIVDHNSNERRIAGGELVDLSKVVSRDTRNPAAASKRILEVRFERGAEPSSPAAFPPERPSTPTLPTQEGLAAGGVTANALPPRRGEEDYQAMRLAVRLASLMAFAVGAVIVFYSMRFSVATRARELMLLVCLGEARRGLRLSLLSEAAILGLTGTLLGMLAGWWAGLALLDAGVSTTGRAPDRNSDMPWGEVGMLASLSLGIALLGVVGPLRSLRRMQPVDVLQPRFLTPGQDATCTDRLGLGWLVPPLMIAAWLAARPFLVDWLSVLHFFLVESAVVVLMAAAVLWWIAPVLKGAVRLAQWASAALLPLESLLAGRRLAATRRDITVTVAAVTLVFSLVIALDGLTRSLKQEIRLWAAQALDPYVFLKVRPGGAVLDDADIAALREEGIYPFRLSRKLDGEIPIRLIAAADVNAYLDAQGRPRLDPARVLVSHTLAERFNLVPGDRVLIDIGSEGFRFVVSEVSDDPGFFATDGQYVDLKSWFLFDAASPLFADNLALTLGELLAVRGQFDRPPDELTVADLETRYRLVGWGHQRSGWQTSEIDRDFSIFDFILGLTLVLAGVGVANSLMIQVLARRRELALLRTLGVSRIQTLRLLLLEGVLIGAVGGLFALLLGNLLAAVGVAFLDRFTLFDYRLWPSWEASTQALGLSMLTCAAAALYPALAANRISSAESLHYE